VRFVDKDVADKGECPQSSPAARLSSHGAGSQHPIATGRACLCACMGVDMKADERLLPVRPSHPRHAAYIIHA